MAGANFSCLSFDSSNSKNYRASLDENICNMVDNAKALRGRKCPICIGERAGGSSQGRNKKEKQIIVVHAGLGFCSNTSHLCGQPPSVEPACSDSTVLRICLSLSLDYDLQDWLSVHISSIHAWHNTNAHSVVECMSVKYLFCLL